VGSGGLDVLATPAMIALMEKAAYLAAQSNLPIGFSTVGTLVEIKHIAATPVGMNIRANAELTGIEDKKLVFKVEAFDESGKIGEGSHERYIISSDKFREKVYSKFKVI
jgi:predicted thioesterase